MIRGLVTSFPPEAAAAVRALGVDPGDLVFQPKPGPSRPMQSYVGSELTLTVGESAAAKRVIGMEIVGRQWAARHEIATPSPIAFGVDHSWLLAPWMTRDHSTNELYVNRALDVADTLMGLPLPEGMPPATTWSGSSDDRWQRLGRLIVGRLPVHRWRTARQRANSLSDVRTAHGDFYPRNVLNVGDHVVIIDWEFLASAPAYTDHLRLWSTLKDKELRQLVIDRIFSGASPQQWQHLCDLGAWLGLRLLAENLSAPAHERNPKDLRHARVVAREAQQLSKLRLSPSKSAPTIA